ncbi:MAG: hypothetical protein Q8M07_13805, partial [Prosthecobacter sp.]|nr:hypothetical protein [Prosthecobacter sp.]
MDRRKRGKSRKKWGMKQNPWGFFPTFPLFRPIMLVWGSGMLARYFGETGAGSAWGCQVRVPF